MERVHALALWLVFPALGAACDKEPSRLDRLVEASTVSSAEPAASAPTPSGPVWILVEPGRFAVGGSSFDTSSASAAADAAAVCLKTANCVKDGRAEVEAKRNAKPSQVATLLAALHGGGAKGATVRTQTRDGTITPFAVSFPGLPVPDCTAVAFIGKDGGISVWRAGGGTAKKYNRGFAGPDMTLGSEAVRNAAARCDSPLLLVGADDAMIWGLVADLVAIARAAPDGGAPLKPTELAIVQSTTPAGRKITADDLK